MTATLENNIPTWLLGLLLIGGTIAVTIAAALIFRRFVKSAQSDGHNEIVGFIFATVGVIYAVLLAFVVFGVWESYAGADQTTAREAGTVIALYRDTNAFPPATRLTAQQRIRGYVGAVLDSEWETMAHSQPSPRALAALDRLFTFYGSLRPASRSEVAVYQESIARLNDLSEERSLRLVASQASLPSIFWVVLILGAIITLAFAILLYLENVGFHLVLNGLLAALLGAALFLILALNRPFSGEVHVPKDSFEYAAKVIQGPVAHAAPVAKP